uniref:Pearli n=1 Tax=Rhizophora mucronata TaxID=61149 RepID=A0A2P2MD96_RHIMU
MDRGVSACRTRYTRRSRRAYRCLRSRCSAELRIRSSGCSKKLAVALEILAI